MTGRAGQANEKPLSGASKLALTCGAGAVILGTYLFAIVSVVLLLVLLLVELAFLIVGLRFGVAGWVAGVMGRHVALFQVFLRSFRLKKGLEFRILLQAGDAPGFFAMLERLCGRAEVALPREVSLEMSTGAWVRLLGYRRGAGSTILGIGYDLLAGLTVAEIEAVLAHEVTHAKLVRRGVKRWLNGGLGRSAKLARGLADFVEAGRRARQKSELAGLFLGVADGLTRTAARLVAAYSRQDEFEADRGAAELCGAGPICSSLMKLEPLEKITSRLPWRERVAQLQAGNGFSQWLTAELSAACANWKAEPAASPFNKYSSHPTIGDRLAALGVGVEASNEKTRPHPGDSRASGISLLAAPDKVAAKLVEEIQRVAAEEEQKDSKRLAKWSRKSSANARLRPLQFVGVMLVVAAGFGVLAGLLGVGFSPGMWIFIVGATGAGIGGYRLGRYRERMELPAPDFAVLKAVWQKKAEWTEAQANRAEAELRAQVAGQRKGQQAWALATEAYAALGRCDYGRAHVAARLCLEKDRKSIEGALALAVAGAGLGQINLVNKALGMVGRATGMNGGSTAWGMGWAALLFGDWGRAEAFLERARQERPDDHNLMLLLALAQSRRGKLQSAILGARRACTPVAAHREHAKLLIELLLQGGYLREAQARLAGIEPQIIREDQELIFSKVRLLMLQRDFAAAGEWVDALRKTAPDAHALVRLGAIYEVARKHEEAAGFYQEALAAGHYPEALLGLGRLEADRRNAAEARGYLLSALDLRRPVGENGVGPVPLLGHILGQFLALEEPVGGCQAWIATLTVGVWPEAIANKTFLVYAPSRPEAERHLKTILAGLQPADQPNLAGGVIWGMAPKEQQPDVPVRPGVQGVR